MRTNNARGVGVMTTQLLILPSIVIGVCPRFQASRDNIPTEFFTCIEELPECCINHAWCTKSPVERTFLQLLTTLPDLSHDFFQFRFQTDRCTCLRMAAASCQQTVICESQRGVLLLLPLKQQPTVSSNQCPRDRSRVYTKPFTEVKCGQPFLPVVLHFVDNRHFGFGVITNNW